MPSTEDDPLSDLAHLRRQGYAIVGRHSAIKLCHWTKKRLQGKGMCYKEKFYGIQCHRCVQMSPMLDRCNLQCQFCWRHMTWQEISAKGLDEPDVIADGCVEAQRKLLTGYGGNPNVRRELLKEANAPNQCAISLTGEPTMYAHLEGLIQALEEKGMRTFLVTNGTIPEAIASLQRLPTQLYVSVTAPDKQTYDKLCSPFGARGWTQLLKTLKLLPSLSCRTVIRHTLVKGWNMHGIDAYAKLDLKASPMFIEAKGFSFVGESRLRMKAENMPTHPEIREWARELANATGYTISDEQVESRVVLLRRENSPSKFK